jgi:hypothetical protein
MLAGLGGIAGEKIEPAAAKGGVHQPRLSHGNPSRIMLAHGLTVHRSAYCNYLIGQSQPGVLKNINKLTIFHNDMS